MYSILMNCYAYTKVYNGNVDYGSLKGLEATNDEGEEVDLCIQATRASMHCAVRPATT